MRRTLAGCAVALLVASVALAGENLVANGGFEQDGGWSTAGIHHPDLVSYSTSTAVEGARGLCQDGRGEPVFMLTQHQIADIKPGTRYAVRGAIRTTATEGHVYIAVHEYSKDGATTTLTLGRGGTRPIGHWQYAGGEFTAREDTQRAYVFLYNINSKGVAWFDDIEVREISEGSHPFDLSCRAVVVPPAIDGALEEWAGSDRAEDMMLLGAEVPVPLECPTAAGVMHDDEHLYVWASLAEPPGYERRGEQLGHDTDVYSDDALELFISADPASGEYYHLCVNANGALYDSHRAAGATGVGDIAWNSGARVAAATAAEGWSVELAIPLTSLNGISGAPGSRFTINVCRSMQSEPQHWSWARLLPGQGFHTPEAFQRVWFTDATDQRLKAVSQYRLLRGDGLIANPDFRQRDENGVQALWQADGTSVRQPLQTGFLAAGTRLEVFATGSDGPDWQCAIRYMTPDGQALEQAFTLTRDRPGPWRGSSALADNVATLTEFSVVCPDGRMPTYIQLVGAGKRAFQFVRKPLYAYHARRDRSVLPPESGAVYTIYDEMSLIRNVASPLMFVNMHTFAEKYYPGDPRLVLDLPRGIEVYSEGLFSRPQRGGDMQVSDTSPHGDGYRRWTLPYRVFKDADYAAYAGIDLTTSLDVGEQPPAFYHLQWDKGAQPEQQLSVRVYPTPAVVAPKRLITGLYVHLCDFYGPEQNGSILSDPRAEQILSDMHGLGLNSVLLGNRWSRVQDKPKLPEVIEFVEKMRSVGFTVGLHTSGFGYFSTLAKAEDGLAVTIDGQTDPSMCPGYRGPAYQALIKAWGDVANYGIYWIDNDFEDWNYRENTICFCTRCKDGFRQWLGDNRQALEHVDPVTAEKAPGEYPELHKAWLAYKNGLIEQWHADVRAELDRVMEAQGVVAPGFPRIGITESHTSWDWKRITQSVVDYDSPMIYSYITHSYAEPAIESAGRRMLEYRQRIGVDRGKYVVTIAPGERTGESIVPDKAQLYEVLEVFGSGAAGFKIWYDIAMNGGKYYWMSEGVRMVAPVEDILLDGEFAVEQCDNPNTRIHSFTHDTGTVLFAAEYSLGAVTVNVPVSVRAAAAVYDLRSGEQIASLKAGDRAFPLTIDEDRARLLFIGTQQQWEALER